MQAFSTPPNLMPFVVLSNADAHSIYKHPSLKLLQNLITSYKITRRHIAEHVTLQEIVFALCGS
jgi:hypothetical protein